MGLHHTKIYHLQYHEFQIQELDFQGYTNHIVSCMINPATGAIALKVELASQANL